MHLPSAYAKLVTSFQSSNERLHRFLALERTQYGDILYIIYKNIFVPKHARYLALARRKRSLFSMPSINNAPPSLSPGDTTVVERMRLTVCHGTGRELEIGNHKHNKLVPVMAK